MTTPHLSLSPFFARTVTALALFRTIAPHFALLRDAFETLEDGLDSILKRSLNALRNASRETLRGFYRGAESDGIPTREESVGEG
jgi:hypothetical protein